MADTEDQIRTLASLSSEEDRKILDLFRTTALSPVEIIPEDADTVTLLKYLKVSTQAYMSAQWLTSRIKPMIGRILCVIKKYPNIYESLGYRNWNHWMSEGVPTHACGMSRSEAFNCVAIAETLDFMPATQMSELGIGKLNVLTNAIRADNDAGSPVEMVQKKRAEWVTLAQESPTIGALRKAVAERLQTEPGELDPRVFVSISVSTGIKERWEEFAERQDIQEYCGSKDPAAIFSQAISEADSGWTAQIMDARRAAALGKDQAE